MKIVIKVLLILFIEIVITSCTRKHSNIQDVVDGYSSGNITADSLFLYLKDPINCQQIKEWAFDNSYSEDPFRQFVRGYCLSRGRGVPKDEEKARVWLEKAADQKVAPAQCLLGDYYYYNQMNFENAYFWYEKAADQGFEIAQVRIAINHGNSVNAFAYLQSAANKEYAPAQLLLGLWYYYGVNNTPIDYKEAVKWYEKAAKQEHLDALCTLGVMYSYGEGVEKNDSIAFMYHKRAADLGHARSQGNVAVCYGNGIFVKQDEIISIHWYKRSANNGDKISQDYLKERGIKWEDE